MSIEVMTTVWKRSSHSGTDLLMLLALADYSDDDGNSYPAVSTLAAKCRMKPRNANYILANLQASGELEVRANEGPKGTNRYRIVLERLQWLQSVAGGGVQHVAGVQGVAGLQCSAPTPAMQCAKPLQPIADKPSLNRQESSKDARKRATAFDATSIALPDWLPRETWVSWVQDRLDRRKPITKRAADKQLRSLGKYREQGHDPEDVISHSIENGYQGLYPGRGSAVRPRAKASAPVLHADDDLREVQP